jgi:hypothetical protein
MSFWKHQATHHRGRMLVIALAFVLAVALGSMRLAYAGQLLPFGLGSGGGAAQSIQSPGRPISTKIQWSKTLPTRSAAEKATEQAGVYGRGLPGAPVGPVGTLPPGSGPQGVNPPLPLPTVRTHKAY